MTRSIEEIDELIKIAYHVDREVDRISRKFVMMMYVNDNKEFRLLYNETLEANGLNEIFDSLLNDIIASLARITDPVSHPGQTDRASIPHVMRFLDNKDILRYFVDQSKKWPGESSKNRSLCARKLYGSRINIKKYLIDKDIFPHVSEIRKYRNIHLSHTLYSKTKEVNMIFGYITDLIPIVRMIATDISLGIRGHHRDDEDDIEEYERVLNQFWRTAAEGMEKSRCSVC